MKNTLLKKHIALPQDHGSWVFLFSPLLIGLFLAPSWNGSTVFLVIGALAAFLMRQPVTMLVKMYSGRRSPRDKTAALFWSAAYGLVGLLAAVELVWAGHGYLLYLTVPAVPVFLWHLFLVSRRAERRQAGLEIVATGTLSLAAPAAYWLGFGGYQPTGWLLWALVWLQAAASIVYAYLRLAQRELAETPPAAVRWQMGRRALLYTSFNLVLVFGLGVAGIVGRWLFLAYLLQWLETLWGITHPAVGVKPTRIGIRQLIVSSLFTILFILFWS
jgi:hypothetical protein